MDAENKLHQTHLAVRALTSELVESGLQQALMAAREQVKAASSQIQAIALDNNVLSAQNTELEAKLADLQQLGDRQPDVSPPAATTSLPSTPTLSEIHPTLEAGPSRPTANRPRIRAGPGYIQAALSGIIRTSVGASTSRRDTQTTPGDTWEEVRGYWLCCAPDVLLT